MNNTDANRMSSYRLTDELARLCLPSAYRDLHRKLAWMNSICIVFLLVGIFGARPAQLELKPVPQVEAIAPVILEPAPAPPQTVATTKSLTESERSVAPRAVIVVPSAPNINFSVPTIGNLVAPSQLAQAPPLRPQQLAPRVNRLSEIGNTGSGGSRPQPPYPRLALEQAEQGTVTLQMTADAGGGIASIEVKRSSGHPILDRATADFIKRHWTLPAGGGTNQLFETSIRYKLQP